MKNFFTFLFCFVIGSLFWLIEPPVGLQPQSLHLLGIFIFTILGIILKPLPMGAMSILGIALVLITNTLPFEQAFSGFANQTVWLIVCAFFISRGFIKTGLGERVAYYLMGKMGKTSLGMGYGMAITDLILAPAIPSVTARTGGIIFPIVTALSRGFDSHPHDHPRKLGAYLMQVAFQGSLISSAMFLTSMSGNPLAADLAANVGIKITWGGWAIAAIVPGMISLLVMPYVLFKLYPPEIQHTPDAPAIAKKKLASLGKITTPEWLMLFTFILLIVLWVAGPMIGVSAVTAAFVGLIFILLLQVLSWSDILAEKSAWDTLIWFAALMMMATYLNKMGLTQYFSDFVVHHMHGMPSTLAFISLTLIYFYSHYFFASNVAHIGSMYPAFLLLMISFGTPPMLAALSLGFFSSLFGGLTQYGSGPAPIIFGAGYVKLLTWWKLGFIFSVINIMIWLGIGSIWWKFLGLF
jgi:DASS family divalent anion:Na+ symporter